MMIFYPEQTALIGWETRERSTDYLIDVDYHDISVYDSSNGKRISYIDTNVTHVSTGKYTYRFIIPISVIPGDWYIRIKSVVGVENLISIIHFEVRER